MSLRGCIEAKVRTAGLDRKRAKAIGDLYDELAAEYRAQGLGDTAERRAAEDARRTLAHQAAETRRRTLLQMRAQARIQARAAASPDDVRGAMLGVLDFDPRGRIAGENVAITRQITRGRAHAVMTAFLDRFHSKAAGLVRPRAGLDNVVRELFGEGTNDATAAELAAGVGEGMEYLRRAFNEAGGSIAKRKDWGLPQGHDRLKLARVRRAEWVDFTLPLLDRARMTDGETGLAFTETRLRAVLHEVYDTIVTNGLTDARPGRAAAMSRVRRRAQSRFLVFRDAEAWLGYQKQFGEADAFQTIVGHVEAMSRDIALIQVLGPNPEATVEFMETLIRQRAGARATEGVGRKAMRAAASALASEGAVRDTYRVLTGEINVPGNPMIAGISQGNRNLVTSAVLGAAFLSALTDLNFQAITARMNGLPATRVLGRLVATMNPLDAADRRSAIRLGFTAQGWASEAIGAQRVLGELVGPAWTARVADTVLRLSLLTPWTQAGRWSFMTELLGFVTDQAGRAWPALPKELRASMTRHGITANDWELMRRTPLWKDPETGAEFLRAQDVLAREDLDPEAAFRLGNKLQAMVMTEAEFAVPAVTARARAIMTGGTRAGTLWGEILRNVTLFKSFPVTMVHTHLQRAIARQGGVAKAKYIAHLIVGTAVLGALGEQVAQVAAGRDPLTMDPADERGLKFWFQALARGGGLGIFGDFLFADVNRYGGGITETMLGPVLGSELPKVLRLTVGNLRQLVTNEDTRAGRDLMDLARGLIPGRSIWYTKLAFERLVLDEIEKTLDPDYAARFRRIERARQRDFGQRYFSPPGRGFPPRRAPDLSRLFKE